MGLMFIAIFVIVCIIAYLSVKGKEEQPFDETEWEEATMLYELSTQESLVIIDDAECHGFEVKRIGTKIYFREMS